MVSKVQLLIRAKQTAAIKRSAGVMLTGLMCLAMSQANTAQEDALDIEYSQRLPLAVDSLLLDVVAGADGGFVAVGERGHVVLSPDGDEWTQAEAVPTRSTLTAITRHGDRLWAAGHDAVILTSGDGGNTWTRQYYGPERLQPIMDIHFLSPDRGLAIGAYGLMLISRDGGATWEDQYVSDEEWHLNALLDLGNGRLVIAGEAGFSYVSEDSGENWAVIEMPYPGSMFGIAASDGECILVYGLRGHMQESCDFGVSWAEFESGTEASLSGAAVIDGGVLVAGNSGVILRREGRGPFEALYHSSGVDFSAVIRTSDGGFLLVGEEGVHHFPENHSRDGVP